LCMPIMKSCSSIMEPVLVVVIFRDWLSECKNFTATP
jgi:hypothetical protein